MATMNYPSSQTISHAAANQMAMQNATTAARMYPWKPLGIGSTREYPVNPEAFRRPAFIKAVDKIRRTPQIRDTSNVSGFYKYYPAEFLFEHLGPLQTIRNGIPIGWVNNMLMAAAAPRKFSEMGMYYSAGIMFLTVPVLGKKARRARLTVTGLELLDMLAEKNKKLKPFVDAYVSKKARKEIYEACFAFQLNKVPEWVKTDNLKHEAALFARSLKNIEALRKSAGSVDWRSTINSQRKYYTVLYGGHTTSAVSSISSGNLIGGYNSLVSVASTNPPYYDISDADIVSASLGSIASQHDLTCAVSNGKVVALDYKGQQHIIWEE